VTGTGTWGACLADAGEETVEAAVINLDGRPTIRVRTHTGLLLGYYPSPASIAAAGFDLARLEIR
jgi:hypothetical protein